MFITELHVKNGKKEKKGESVKWCSGDVKLHGPLLFSKKQEKMNITYVAFFLGLKLSVVSG